MLKAVEMQAGSARRLNVRELKAELERLGVDSSQCLERSELEGLLAKHGGSSGGNSSSFWGSRPSSGGGMQRQNSFSGVGRNVLGSCASGKHEPGMPKIHASPHNRKGGKRAEGMPRGLFLLLRHFGPKTQITWHWGIGVGEGRGRMPRELIDYNGPAGVHKKSDINTWDAYIKLPASTSRSDEEIDDFIASWQAAHPVYDAMFNNCQNFASDLHEFLVGKELPYPRVGQAVGNGIVGGVLGVLSHGSKGIFTSFKDGAIKGAWDIQQHQPQNDSRAVWLKSGARPKKPREA